MNTNNYIVSNLLCVLSSLRKKWRLLILLSCFVAVGYDIISALVYKPVYSAQVNCAIVNSSGQGIGTDQTQNALSSMQYLFNSQYMKNLVNTDLAQESFQGHVDMWLTGDTNFCTIRSLSDTQRSAYFELSSLLEIYNTISEQYSFGYNLVIIDDISFSNMPLSTHSHTRSYVIGFSACMILSCAGLGLYYYFKDNIKNAHAINDKIEAKLFTKVPKEWKRYQKWGLLSRKKSPILVSRFKTGFSYIEALNKLASKVEMAQKEHGYKSFLITSALENEGKSSIATNLAISLAKNKKRVLLIDADLRKPSLHKIFEHEVTYSLKDVMNKNIKWQKAIVPLRNEQIFVIFSQPTHNPLESLADFDFQSMLEEMKQYFDYIIVDTAPCRFIVDTIKIAPACDASLIIIKQNGASCKVINDAIYRLTNTSANVIGSIYNESVYNPFYSHSKYGYKYGYYRYYKERK